MTTQAQDYGKILAFIAACDDPKKLKQLAENANRIGALPVAEAAERKLYGVQAKGRPGTIEYDVWQSIHALEDALQKERGQTVRLSRTRQKIGRVGELQTVIDLVLGKPSTGFFMLIERGWPELTFEAVALNYIDDPVVRARAEQRLLEHGVDPLAAKTA